MRAARLSRSAVQRVKAPPPAYVTRRVLRQRGPAIPNVKGNAPGFGSNIMTGFRNHLRNRQLGRIILGKEKPEHMYAEKMLKRRLTPKKLPPHVLINNKKGKRPSERINLSLAIPSYLLSTLQASPVQSTSQSVRSPSPPPPPKKPKKKVKGQSTPSVVVMLSPVSLSRRPTRRRTKHNKTTSAPLF